MPSVHAPTRRDRSALVAAVIAACLAAPVVGAPEAQNPTSGILARSVSQASPSSKEAELTGAVQRRVASGSAPDPQAAVLFELPGWLHLDGGAWWVAARRERTAHACLTPLLVAPKTSPPRCV